MEKIVEEDMLFHDVAVFGDDKEHAYRVDCYDGWGLGVALKDENSSDVPAEIIVRYPKMEEVLEGDLADYVLAYRGLGKDKSMINYGDIMAACGRIDIHKIDIDITAHISEEPCVENSMELYSRTFNRWDAFAKTHKPFLAFLTETFPMLAWEEDDGDDNYGSEFSQYVAYTEGYGSNNYVLAVLQSLD